jgi:hypothetical protein
MMLWTDIAAARAIVVDSDPGGILHKRKGKRVQRTFV